MFILDTCGLIWYTLDPDKLSAKAAEACALIASNGAFVSSISIWEIGLKVKNQKLEIGTSIEDYVSRLQSLGSIEIIPVDENIWMRNLALEWSHRDPADRTIVATAELKKLPILTSDSLIQSFYPDIIW